jgi:hypothetical protein
MGHAARMPDPVIPTCCEDGADGEMVVLRGPRRLWGLLRGAVIGYVCAWCGREAGPGEPERQAQERYLTSLSQFPPPHLRPRLGDGSLASYRPGTGSRRATNSTGPC